MVFGPPLLIFAVIQQSLTALPRDVYSQDQAAQSTVA